jgi:outer membrane receptor protein involved in Fe transport
LNLRMNRVKYNITLGVGYQATRLKGDGQFANQPFEINRPFNNVLPVARFNYDFSTFKHLRFDYETSMQEPTITQLQPVIDNSNPINIYEGNPNLRPSYVQSVNLNFNTFDPAKFTNFFAMATLRYQTDAIVNAQNTDPATFIRTTTPVNVKDALNANLNLNYGFRIEKLRSRFNLGATASQNKAITVLDDAEYNINTESLGGTARYNFTYKEIFFLDLSANIRNSNTKYNTNAFDDQQFINSTYSAEGNVTILKNWQLSADYNYYVYDSKTTDFKQSVPILNIWLSRFLLKANAGEVRVGVSNLLDQSLGITQTAAQNYIQQERLNNLGRYLMVSFTYALNKQLNPMGGGRRGGGGMRMIMTN